jgi:hypothetical protein
MHDEAEIGAGVALLANLARILGFAKAGGPGQGQDIEIELPRYARPPRLRRSGTLRDRFLIGAIIEDAVALLRCRLRESAACTRNREGETETEAPADRLQIHEEKLE